MGLLPTTATISGGIDFMGQDMFALSDRQLSKLRGDKISMIFQDPLSALTPVYTIGDQNRRGDPASPSERLQGGGC